MVSLDELFEDTQKLYLVAVTFIVLFFVAIFSMQFGVTTHELSHFAAASIFCDGAAIETNVLTGSTTFGGCFDFPGVLVIISLASIIGAFFVGLILWYAGGENSILRFVGLIVIVYSVIPSAFPILGGSDMFFAIQNGFNPIIGWLIFIIMLGVFSWIATEEITERKLSLKI